MTGSAMVWKKGRGKLGIFQPLLGTWRAKAESPMGVVICTRTFSKVLDGAYIQLEAQWDFEPTKKSYSSELIPKEKFVFGHSLLTRSSLTAILQMCPIFMSSLLVLKPRCRPDWLEWHTGLMTKPDFTGLSSQRPEKARIDLPSINTKRWEHNQTPNPFPGELTTVPKYLAGV